MINMEINNYSQHMTDIAKGKKQKPYAKLTTKNLTLVWKPLMQDFQPVPEYQVKTK